jgi:Predicted O-methyltransferase
MKDIKNFAERLKIINSFDGNLVFGSKSFNLSTNRTGKGPSNGLPTKELLEIMDDTKKDRFLRKSVGWVAKEECNVCGSRNRFFLLNRLGLTYYKCKDCSHIYQDPILSESAASNLYSKEETTTKIYKSSNQQEMDEIKFSYGVDLINSFVKKESRKSILDIGCGAGYI